MESSREGHHYIRSVAASDPILLAVAHGGLAWRPPRRLRQPHKRQVLEECNDVGTQQQ
jgi:hypothetical protein